MSPASINNTLLLYTTPAIDPSGQAYWAFRTLPALPQFDTVRFDTLYGPRGGSEDFSMFFADFSPQLSPNGRTLLLPGLTGNLEQGIEGTGTWLVDLATGAARQLLPNGVIATWNPTGDAIAYADGDTLFTLSTAEGATPESVFQNPDLWDIYAKWSPDGQWIAAVSGVQHEPTGEEQTTLTFTYWLVPADGEPARELAQRETGAGGYSARTVSWSPDGQYLLAHNLVYDLAGNQLIPGDIGWIEWLPDRPQLLNRADEGLRVITATGEEIVVAQQSAFHSAMSYAFSRDGRHLAFSLPAADNDVPLAISDLESGETQIVGVVPDALYVHELAWSADDTVLIAGADHGEACYHIWTLPAAPNSTAERLLADAVLIEAVPTNR